MRKSHVSIAEATADYLGALVKVDEEIKTENAELEEQEEEEGEASEEKKPGKPAAATKTTATPKAKPSAPAKAKDEDEDLEPGVEVEDDEEDGEEKMDGEEEAFGCADLQRALQAAAAANDEKMLTKIDGDVRSFVSALRASLSSA